MHKYALRYKLETEIRNEGYTKEDIKDNDDYGLSDVMILTSIILPEDGSYSQALFTAHGKEKRELTQDEIFKAWMMMGICLHDQKGLNGWKADCVEFHTNMIRSLFNHIKDCAIVKENKDK